MRPVGLIDQGFLWLEGRNQPMHVAGLQLLTPPKDDPDWIQHTVDAARAATRAYAPFNQRLVRKGGMWFWEDDRDFDVEQHFYHISLPKPGRVRELLTIVSKRRAARKKLAGHAEQMAGSLTPEAA